MGGRVALRRESFVPTILLQSKKANRVSCLLVSLFTPEELKFPAEGSWVNGVVCTNSSSKPLQCISQVKVWSLQMQQKIKFPIFISCPTNAHAVFSCDRYSLCIDIHKPCCLTALDTRKQPAEKHGRLQVASATSVMLLHIVSCECISTSEVTTVRREMSGHWPDEYGSRRTTRVPSVSKNTASSSIHSNDWGMILNKWPLGRKFYLCENNKHKPH